MSMPLVKCKKNVYSDVYEETTSLPDMIDFTDVDESAKSWEEVSHKNITQEVQDSTAVIMGESQFKNKARNLAMYIWVKDLNRASMNDLVFDSEEEALKQGYLPFSMSWREAKHELTQMHNNNKVNIPNSAWDEAYTVIRAAVVDKLDPNSQKGESLLYNFN